jgi:hypothetical protein
LKKNILLFGGLIICLFLSSCGPVGTTPVSVSASASTPPETKPSMTPFYVETKEILIPTITSIPKCDSNAGLLLADAILTPKDMIEKYPIFEADNRWNESVNLTNELLKENGCGVDCAKLIWSPGIASITLINRNTREEANELVDVTRKTFTDILEITDRPYITDLAQNAWVAYDKSQHEFVLLYSYGSIFAQIINRPDAGFDDFAGEFDLTYALGRLQNEKLCSNGYDP